MKKRPHLLEWSYSNPVKATGKAEPFSTTKATSLPNYSWQPPLHSITSSRSCSQRHKGPKTFLISLPNFMRFWTNYQLTTMRTPPPTTYHSMMTWWASSTPFPRKTSSSSLNDFWTCTLNMSKNQLTTSSSLSIFSNPSSTSTNVPTRWSPTIQRPSTTFTTTNKIHLKHIIDIIQLSITLGVVAVQGKCYKQILGSTIGNQISPTICSIPILFREAEWKDKYQSWLQLHANDLWYERYVDNRFAIIPKPIYNDQPLEEFSDPWFYRKPIQLETVPDTHFLGTNIDINNRQITFMLPTERWQIQPIHSAASASKLLSSFRTRLHLLTSQTFPKTKCAEPTNQLMCLYRGQGFSPSTLMHIAERHFRLKAIPNAHLLRSAAVYSQNRNCAASSTWQTN